MPEIYSQPPSKVQKTESPSLNASPNSVIAFSPPTNTQAQGLARQFLSNNQAPNAAATFDQQTPHAINYPAPVNYLVTANDLDGLTNLPPPSEFQGGEMPQLDALYSQEIAITTFNAFLWGKNKTSVTNVLHQLSKPEVQTAASEYFSNVLRNDNGGLVGTLNFIREHNIKTKAASLILLKKAIQNIPHRTWVQLSCIEKSKLASKALFFSLALQNVSTQRQLVETTKFCRQSLDPKDIESVYLVSKKLLILADYLLAKKYNNDLTDDFFDDVVCPKGYEYLQQIEENLKNPTKISYRSLPCFGTQLTLKAILGPQDFTVAVDTFNDRYRCAEFASINVGSPGVSLKVGLSSEKVMLDLYPS